MQFLILLSLLINIHLIGNVELLDVNELRSSSIIYGTLSIAVEDYRNLTKCYADLEVFFNSVNQNHVWSLKAMDASGVPDSGFYDGNNFWIGSHQFCLELQDRNRLKINYNRIPNFPINNYTYPPYKMNFLIYNIKHNSTIQVHFRRNLDDKIILGLCVPESCQAEDLKPLLEEYFRHKYLTFQAKNNLDLRIVNMRKLHDDGFWIFRLRKTIIAMIILAILSTFVTTGTLLGVLHRRESKHLFYQFIAKKKKLYDVLLCFDISVHGKSILTFKKPPPSVIPCLDGLRMFSIFVIIIGHCIIYKLDYMKSLSPIIRDSEIFLLQLISNGSLAPDTFFFIGGFLISYSFFTKKRNDVGNGCTKFSSLTNEFFSNIIGRYIRLTPNYAAVIITANVLYTYLKGNYPINFNENSDITCDRYWWTNLLYINNFLYKKDMCLSWTYYNAIDMQLYIISTFILLLSTVFFKISVFLVMTFICSSIVYTAYVVYDIKMLSTLDDWWGNLDHYYHSPIVRGQSYFVGLITGYLLCKKIGKTLQLKRVYFIAIWMLTAFGNSYVLFCLYIRDRSVLFTMFYMSLSRIVWCIGLAWITIASYTNNGGVLNKMLSIRTNTVLSKLTYSAYLLNPLLLTTFFESSSVKYNQTLSLNALDTVGIVSAAYYFALVLSLSIEYPFMALYKLFKQRTKKETFELTNDKTKAIIC